MPPPPFLDTARDGADATPAQPGRRWHLTLLFCDLSDSTRLGEWMEAEDYGQLMAAVRTLSREVVARHGGQIARLQGDGGLALFGYPEAREDDGRRATEAALELHAAVSALPFRGPEGAPLTMHSGIHAGLVLVSDGDLERGRFELLGNAPNVAARLSAIAAADDVLVSEETLGPLAHFFATGDRTALQLKGRAAPLWACRVLGRAPADNRFEAMSRRGLGPFVGREQPLRQLREQLRLAVAGERRCVALCGSPGMGKTRLVEELLRHAGASRCRVLRGHCESYLIAEPLQPFAQMLRAVQAEQQALAGEPGASDAVMRAAPAAFATLFAGVPGDPPLLLVIDDWQWADQASQQVLDQVLAFSGSRLCVVLACRDRPENLPAAASVIELVPLTDTEATETVRHLLPGADPFLVAEIQRHAGGIPLFIEELCHSAAAQGPQGIAGLAPNGRAWLNGLIQSRVGRLSSDEAQLLRAAAVLGNVFPGWLLERITGHAPDSATVRRLAERDFIFPAAVPGSLRFKHGITRDVVYESVGLHERTALHRRVAEALPAGPEDADAWIESLAYHCAAGGWHAQAARHAERAGDKALAAPALDRARAQYTAALRALDALAPLDRERELQWCVVAQKLGMACVFDPLALTDGLATFERGVALARASGDLQLLARAEYWLGYLCYAKGLSRRAIAHCEAALDLAMQQEDGRLAAQVRATLGQALLAASRYGAALPLLDTALDTKRRQTGPGSNIAVGSAYTLACKGYLLGDCGHFAGADDCFAEAMQLLGDARHQVAASVLHWVSVVRQWQGRWEEALRAADAASAIAEHVKSRQQLAMGHALAGHARWMIAREPRALQAVRDATAWIEARKGGLATSLNHGWLVEGALAERRGEGSLAARRGDEARRHAARLLQRARHDDRIGEALGCRALALDAGRRHDFAQAGHWLRRAQHSADVRGSAHEAATNALCHANLLLQQGNAGEARRELDAARAAFEAMRMQWHLERAERLARQL